MRATFLTVLCCVLVACQSVKGHQTKPLIDASVLGAVQSIYIEDLGHDDGANLIEETSSIRELIRSGLAKSGRFSIVQDPQQADAVLTGLVGVEPWYHGMEGYYGMEGDLDDHEVGVGKLQLIDSKTKQTIWTHNYESGFLNPDQTVGERVANQVVEKLLQDASRTDSEQPNAHK